MTHPILFLDIDGVLIHALCPREHRCRVPDPECVARLNRIIQEADCHVVVSSTWRIGKSLEELQLLLTGWGVHEAWVRVVGKTDEAFERGILESRPDEISRWLRDHKHTGRFLIIDDWDMKKQFRREMILIHEGWEKGGLQDRHVERALGKLR